MRDLNVNAFWWYHDYHFATNINIEDWQENWSPTQWKIVLSHKWFWNANVILSDHHDYHFATSIGNWDHTPLSIIISDYHFKTVWGEEADYFEEEGEVIYVSSWYIWITEIRTQSTLNANAFWMIPWLSFCNKHQYWDLLSCEVWLSKTVLRWLFWKRGHLVSSWYIWIMEMRTQSTFNHNISLSLSTIWGEEAEYIE